METKAASFASTRYSFHPELGVPPVPRALVSLSLSLSLSTGIVAGARTRTLSELLRGSLKSCVNIQPPKGNFPQVDHSDRITEFHMDVEQLFKTQSHDWVTFTSITFYIVGWFRSNTIAPCLSPTNQITRTLKRSENKGQLQPSRGRRKVLALTKMRNPVKG